MNKYLIKHSIFKVTLVFLTCACASTSTVHHDKKEGNVYLFSHTDSASNEKKVKSDAVTTDVIATLKKRLKSNPRDIESSLSLANIYLALSQSKESINYAKYTLRFDIKEHRARLILAQNYFRMKKFKLAEIILSSLPAKYAKDPDIINIKALIAFRRGRNSEAWNMFNDGIKKNPSHIALSMNFGVLLLKYRQIEKAEAIFKNVTRLVPEHSDANLHLAIIEATKGNFDEAEERIKSIASDRNRLNLFNVGMIAYAKKDYKRAELLLKSFMSDRSANKLAIESASIVLEKIASKDDAFFKKAYAKRYSKSDFEKNKVNPDFVDEEVDELEKILLK